MVFVLDEAQHLYSWVETLETLREIGDLARERAGIIVAGNEQVEQIFEPRRHTFFEQWRSRIEQKRSASWGRRGKRRAEMISGEVGQVKESAAAPLLDDCTVNDPLSRRTYVNARRLFNSLRDIPTRVERGMARFTEFQKAGRLAVR